MSAPTISSFVSMHEQSKRELEEVSTTFVNWMILGTLVGMLLIVFHPTKQAAELGLVLGFLSTLPLWMEPLLVKYATRQTSVIYGLCLIMFVKMFVSFFP